MRFLTYTLLFFGISAAAAAAPPCQTDLEASETGIASFHPKPFRNAGMLLEFFGPMKNSLRTWLRGLESGAPATAAGPGIYVAGNGSLIVGKEMKYPFDGGLSEFRSAGERPRMITALMEFRDEQIKTMSGPSDEARANREILLRQLDTHLFGLYGALENNSHDNLLMRTIQGDHTLTASLHPRIRIKATPDWLGLSSGAAPGNPAEDLAQVAQVIAQTDSAVMVKVKLGGEGLSQNAELIQRLFFITHWQMVQRAYRKSALFDDNLKTSLYLLDDFIHSMETSGGRQDLYLLYDARAWSSMMFRLNLAHRYVSIHMFGLGWQPYMYQTIADVFYPFYPEYGMIVENYAPNEFEFKRLFHNADPDPLKMLPTPGGARVGKFYFYQEVGKTLPAKAILKAVSKSSLHTRLYKGIGFKLRSSEFIPAWKAQKDTLFMTREEFVRKTE